MYRPATELYTGTQLAADLELLSQWWNPAPDPYSDDPVGWIANTTKEELWSKQRDILGSIQSSRYTAVKSCHGAGKSFIASRIAAWWIATKEDPFVVTSAPTGHQVRTVLWREIQRAKNRANIEGRITHGQVPEWKIRGELIGFGRKPADYLDPAAAAAAFQGIHALNVLVLLDEGSGIPDWLATACETLITNENSRLLVIGNPDNPASWFANCFKPQSTYNKITIKWTDTPNYTGEQVSDALADRLVSQVWVDERKQRWGEHSPLYAAKVNAEFPTVTDDTVFNPAIIEKGQLCDRSRQASVQKLADSRYGMDVAALGQDETVLYHNRNGYVRISHRWAKRDTMGSVGEFRRVTREDPALVPTTVVDATGYGSGVYDRLKELNYSVVPFNGGERAWDDTRFANRRAESYWTAAEAMDQGLIDIDPDDHDLAAELLEPHFHTNSHGRIVLETKDDIRARLGRSPDRADAFVMSLQKQVALGRLLKTQQNSSNVTPTERHQDQESSAATVSDVMDMQF